MPEMRTHLSRIEDYPAHLEACWREHLAPKAEDAPTVVSLFAGCSGSSLGYSMAGYRELLAVEWDGNAVETFKLNFPGVPVWHGDIAELSVEECLRVARLKPGELDVLDGSPPCQGFSTAGKRKMEDGRNQLFREYVRLLRGLQPKVLVMENVSGMVKGKMKLIFAEILRELKASGYRVSARLMNAMYFGVPQSRERMIFIGTRNDQAIPPGHPGARNAPIPVRRLFPHCDGTRSQRINPWIPSDEPAATVCSTAAGYELKEGEIKPTWQMYRVLTGQEKRKHFGLVRLDPDRPSPTIVRDCGNTTMGMIHPHQIRKLTISEVKNIASFPEQFQMTGSYRERWARLGNSVPPLFMRAIAGHIKDSLLPANRKRTAA